MYRSIGAATIFGLLLSLLLIGVACVLGIGLLVGCALDYMMASVDFEAAAVMGIVATAAVVVTFGTLVPGFPNVDLPDNDNEPVELDNDQLEYMIERISEEVATSFPTTRRRVAKTRRL